MVCSFTDHCFESNLSFQDRPRALIGKDQTLEWTFHTCGRLCTAEWNYTITVEQVSPVPTELLQPALKTNYTRKIVAAEPISRHRHLWKLPVLPGRKFAERRDLKPIKSPGTTIMELWGNDCKKIWYRKAPLSVSPQHGGDGEAGYIGDVEKTMKRALDGFLCEL